MTTDQRGEVWAILRAAVEAGERVGAIGPALGYEQRSAKLDALAREYADRIRAALSTEGDV